MALFRFDNFCEAFAQIYRPISHIPSKDGRQTRFFRHNGIDERSEIHKRLSNHDKCDLFMSVITAWEGDLERSSENAPDPNFYGWRRHVLFWAHQAPAELGVVPNDEEAAADAKARAVEACQDFIAFMAKCKDKNGGNMKDLQGVDFDSMEISTLPMAFNGFWIAILNFDQMEPRQKCVIDEKYDTTSIEQFFPFFHHDRFHK